MAEKEIDERETEILRRMTESRGGLNRQQAENAVEQQEIDDALKAKEKQKADAAARKVAAEKAAADKAAADKAAADANK